jgi:DNA-binding response OmpR family regulator
MPKVFVVDDSPVVCHWAQEALSTDKIDCSAYMIPFGVYKVAAGEQPDLVVLDLDAPGLNGQLVCRMLKRTHPTLRVVMHSSLPVEALAHVAAEAGADGFIEKSQSPARFALAVRSHLNRLLPAA